MSEFKYGLTNDVILNAVHELTIANRSNFGSIWRVVCKDVAEGESYADKRDYLFQRLRDLEQEGMLVCNYKLSQKGNSNLRLIKQKIVSGKISEWMRANPKK